MMKLSCIHIHIHIHIHILHAVWLPRTHLGGIPKRSQIMGNTCRHNLLFVTFIFVCVPGMTSHIYFLKSSNPNHGFVSNHYWLLRVCISPLSIGISAASLIKQSPAKWMCLVLKSLTFMLSQSPVSLGRSPHLTFYH